MLLAAVGSHAGKEGGSSAKIELRHSRVPRRSYDKELPTASQCELPTSILERPNESYSRQVVELADNYEGRRARV